MLLHALSYSVGSVQHTISEGSMAQHKQFFGENIPKNSGNSNSQLPPRHQLSGNRLVLHNYYYFVSLVKTVTGIGQ